MRSGSEFSSYDAAVADTDIFPSGLAFDFSAVSDHTLPEAESVTVRVSTSFTAFTAAFGAVMAESCA